MITKERLEELIQQGATIYVITTETFIAGVSGLIGVKKEELSKENNVGKDNILYWKDMGIAELENPFETEEDARWELEMTATRTETLKMPRFESIIEPNKTFVLYEDDKFLGFITVDQQIVINYYKIGEIKRIFDKPLTKENYIEACKLCLRLFKGEEV